MTTLQPCPFCGSKDIEVEREGTNRQSCVVSCADCGCRLESNEIGSGQQWNERVITTPVLNKIGKYIEAMEAIEAMCKTPEEPEFRVYYSAEHGSWLAALIKVKSWKNSEIEATGTTLEEAVINLKETVGKK
jgi:Lar family restriction alleviation protein